MNIATRLREFHTKRQYSEQIKHRSSRRESYELESLETRILLSADLFGLPDFDAAGPAPIMNGQASAAPNNQVLGAVEALAAHPTDSDILYAGGVNGGVWRTDNATSTSPDWTPLTDQFPTLAISDLAFSPLDATNNTIFAGTGGFSNGAFDGPARGILRSTDGGQTWQQFGEEFGSSRVRSIVPTAIGTSLDDQVVLAAVIDAGGVFRSTDGGETFTRISGSDGSSDGIDNDADGVTDEAGEVNLPAGAASFLAPDPGNSNRFYAALPNQGVFRSDDAGLTWRQVNNGITGIAGSNNIELSVSAATGNPVYAAVLSPVPMVGTQLQNVFRSTDAGATWTQLGTAPNATPGGQGFTDFSILADNADPNVVYIGGDREPASPFFGAVFRGDASTNVWTDLTTTAIVGMTAPHADSRDMVFDANSNIVESDDGGVFRLTNPSGNPTSGWANLNSDLQVSEFYSTTYDHVANLIFGGMQDTGSAIQTAPGSSTFTSVNMADGGDSSVAYSPDDTDSVRYTIGNNFKSNFRRTFASGGTALLALNGLDATDSAFMKFRVFPYEANNVDWNRIVIGGINALYESTDFGDNLNTITPAGDTGPTAMAYGGRQAGMDNPDLLYAGVGNNLYLRTTSGGALNQLNAYPGFGVVDIAIDPDDWDNVYVTDGSAIFHSTDGGDQWDTINTAGLSALTNQVFSIELFSPSSTVGDEVLLAGGSSGLLRTLNPNDGGDAVWSEFGANLTNALVNDIQYDSTDDILILGAWGRGIWALPNASAVLTTESAIVINGDEDFSGQDDTITLIRDQNNPTLLNVFVNNDVTPEVTVPIAAVMQINVNGLGGNDTLIVDSSNGLINVVNGIRFDGGTGMDELQLLQTDGTTQTRDTYSVGPVIGSGNSVIVGSGGTQAVSFENLSPVIDLVPATTLTVNATPADNAISYTAGSVAGRGRVTIDEQESIEFSNKQALRINAGGGEDTVSVNNPMTPTGLAGITVNGGDPGGIDTLNVTGVGQAVLVNTASSSINGATGASGAVDISYSGIEALELLADIGDLAFVLTSADDTAIVTPGSATGANTGGIQSAGATPGITFVNSGDLSFAFDGGDNQLTVNASPAGDTIAVSGTVAAIMGRRTVTYIGADSVQANGDAGSDTFNVTPDSLVSISIDGGDPVGVLPGDRLNINAMGGPVSYNVGPESDEGSFAVGANMPVSFDRIESSSVTGAASAAINGTDAPDAVSIIARDSSTHAGADGVRDFTAAVNNGPEILFLDVAGLSINARGGSDEITLQTPAPNGAAWDVDTVINGGLPGVDGDRVVVQTPGQVTATYTPTAFDAGTLNIESLSSLATLQEVELLEYDGQGDNDTLNVQGTSGDDDILHSPGADDQSGRFQVNSLLGIAYQNVGPNAGLTVNGLSGINALTYNGTAGNDVFTIGAAGQIDLNTRVPLVASNIQTLTLEGFDGDDIFTLVPPISASPFATLNLNGGAAASAAGDRVNLVATNGDDNVTVSGGTVSDSGVTVNANGVEDIRLDMLGGNDLLTYNGVDGVSEDIRVTSSGVAGGGQLSVPDLVLLSFSGVERIDVNGNAPGSSDTDTLTFAGTNGDDTFNINLAADATDADPILTLDDTSATTLLTLRSYTNFETLNVLGLQGEDVFNVATDPTGPSRNLFVDGGTPTGKKKSTDQLNITWVRPRPRIISSKETQNPTSGLVDLDYGTARYLVTFSDIETVTVRKV